MACNYNTVLSSVHGYWNLCLEAQETYVVLVRIRGILTLIWIAGAAVIAGIVVLL